MRVDSKYHIRIIIMKKKERCQDRQVKGCQRNITSSSQQTRRAQNDPTKESLHPQMSSRSRSGVRFTAPSRVEQTTYRVEIAEIGEIGGTGEIESGMSWSGVDIPSDGAMLSLRTQGSDKLTFSGLARLGLILGLGLLLGLLLGLRTLLEQVRQDGDVSARLILAEIEGDSGASRGAGARRDFRAGGFQGPRDLQV